MEIERASRGYSQSANQSGATTSGNFSTSREAQVQPNDFSVLRKGGASNEYQVDAVLYQGGRFWNASQKCFLHVTFDQRNND